MFKTVTHFLHFHVLLLTPWKLFWNYIRVNFRRADENMGFLRHKMACPCPDRNATCNDATNRVKENLGFNLTVIKWLINQTYNVS